jgi:phosphoribosyl-AMP cyclohydrolase
MDFTKLDGLIPAVVQDATSGEVLMVGFMNEEAWALTREKGYVTFLNRLKVEQLFIDCDEDTVLVKAAREGDGNVCHTGARSCFSTEVTR